MGRGFGAIVEDYDGGNPPFWDQSNSVTHEISQKTTADAARRVGEEETARRKLPERIDELTAAIEGLEASIKAKASTGSQDPSAPVSFETGIPPEVMANALYGYFTTPKVERGTEEEFRAKAFGRNAAKETIPPERTWTYLKQQYSEAHLELEQCRLAVEKRNRRREAKRVGRRVKR